MSKTIDNIARRIDWEHCIDSRREILNLKPGEGVPLKEVRLWLQSQGLSESEIDIALSQTERLSSVSETYTEPRVCLTESIDGIVENKSNNGSGAISVDSEVVMDCFREAIEYMHHCASRTVDEFRQSDVDHTSATEYYADERGWSDEIIVDRKLGWAPIDSRELVDKLATCGYGYDEMLLTGLFFEKESGDVLPLWRGRYIFPYFDSSGNPVYAIARRSEATNDGLDGKYAKLKQSIDGRETETYEPIYGLDTIGDDDNLVVAEGIADAISLYDEGYPAISPVARTFKQEHVDILEEVIESNNIKRLYVISDADPPSPSLRDVDDPGRITDKIDIPAVGAGQRAVCSFARSFSENVEVRIVVPPSMGVTDKIDLDDYVQLGASIQALIRSAKPIESHRLSNILDQDRSDRSSQKTPDTSVVGGSCSKRSDAGSRSALFDLTFSDLGVTGSRGKNPITHRGDSENYFVVVGQQEAYDHKGEGKNGSPCATYTPLLYILVEAGERRVENPHGKVSDRELWVAYKHAKRNGYLSSSASMPSRAMTYLTTEKGYDPDPADLTREERAAAWIEAESRDGVAPRKDGKVPYYVLVALLEYQDLIAETDLPDWDNNEGGMPQRCYDASLLLLADIYDIDPGRTPVWADGDFEEDPETMECTLIVDMISDDNVTDEELNKAKLAFRLGTLSI